MAANDLVLVLVLVLDLDLDPPPPEDSGGWAAMGTPDDDAR